jgi:hypothetical protein
MRRLATPPKHRLFGVSLKWKKAMDGFSHGQLASRSDLGDAVMATGLFDNITTSDAESTSPREVSEYRAVSGWAIGCLVLTVLSPLAFADWWLAVVPLTAIVVGLVGWRQISLRPDALVGAPLAIGGVLVSACLLVAGLTTLTQTYIAELPEGFVRINYQMLQPLDGDPATAVPQTAFEADGKDVLLKGFMYPGSEQEGIVQFLLVRDQGDCCFGGNPKITDRVLVNLRDPEGIDFTPRMVKIAGRFAIRPAGSTDIDGGVLYHIEDAFVR